MQRSSFIPNRIEHRIIRAFIRTNINGAFIDILHTNPHLVGRSHPVSVEVREFDWE